MEIISNFKEIKDKMDRQLLIIHSNKSELEKLNQTLTCLKDINLQFSSSEEDGIRLAQESRFCLILIEGKLINDLTISKLNAANIKDSILPPPYVLLLDIDNKEEVNTISRSDFFLSSKATTDDLVNIVTLLLRTKLLEHNNCHIPDFCSQNEETSFEFSWILDKNFKNVYISPSIIDIRGITAEEALKENIKDTMPVESYKLILKTNEEISKAAKSNNKKFNTKTEFQHYHKDGSLIWVEALCWPIFDDNDNYIGLKGVTRDINKRKKVELSLIENEQKYKDLIENSLEGIYVIKDKKVLFGNLQFAKIFGYDHVDDIKGVKIKSLIHPDDVSLVKNKTRLREESKDESTSYEFRGIQKDGTTIWLETLGDITIVDQKPVIQGVIRNITKKKESDELIRKLSRSVEQSPVTIIITNIKGNIEYVNPKFTEISGYSFEEVKGKNPGFLKSESYSSSEVYKDLWDTITSGKVWRGELLNKKKNGELFWELTSISPIKNKKGETTHFIGFKEEITERKRMEKELLEAKRKAEEADMLKTSFLANMSHEIRTPMNAIMGFSGLLSDENLSFEERIEFIDLINNNSNTLLTLIDDIIDIAKIEAGQLKIIRKDFNLNDIMREICAIYQKVKFKESKEHLKLIFDEENSSNIELIHTDAHRLKQVVSNLVGNAIKYTLNGSINFGYKLISSIEGSKKQQIQIYVKDTGIGIEADKIDIIFERFRQADESHTRIFGGTGLGLAISQNIARLLGGDIKVVSKIDHGSLFYFTIPYQQGKNVREESFKSIEKAKTLDWSDKTILIAEDVESNYLLINTILKRTKVKIIWVKNGKQAIKEFDSRNDIDLILMDMQMPILNGYEATSTIKSLNENIPIIAVTAFALEGDKEKILKAGCNDYISKPVKSELLVSKIKSYFKN